MWHRIGKAGKKVWGHKGAGFLFTDGDHILILRRAETHEQDTWGLPGGKSEDGEDAFATAKRECEEEIGRMPTHARRIGKFEEKNGLHSWTTFIMRVDKPFGDIRLSKEHSDWRWVPINTILGYRLHPKLKENIKRYIHFISIHIPRGFKEWSEAFAAIPNETDNERLIQIYDQRYKRATGDVGGLSVKNSVDNTSSISASFNNYYILKDIREVPLSQFNSNPKQLFYAADDMRRTEQLAQTIKTNGFITPLIVAVDEKNGPYILEGAHRLGALHMLQIPTFPAMVVIDLDR